MSNADKRLDKLYPGLTARERATQVLLAFKEDRDEDPQVRRTMPRGQVPEFNQYIGLMNAVNGHFGLFISILGLLVGELDTRCGWLVTLMAWGRHASTVTDYLSYQAKEPVTESEYREKLEKERRRMAPASKLAEVLMDQHHWAEEDMEAVEEGEEPEVKEEAFARVLAEKEREIAALVEAGTLQGKGTGKKLRVSVGGLYDWLGEEVPVWSEWGSRYEVLSDDLADLVVELRQLRSALRERLYRSPIRFAEGLPPEKKRKSERDKWSWDETAEMMVAELRARIQTRWQELLAAETVLEEAREEFGGEEVLQPKVREELEEAKETLQKLAEQMEPFGDPIDLVEPTEQQVADTGALLKKMREVFVA